MAPLAHAVHRTRGRLRLRIPARRHDQAFFDRLTQRLCNVPGVLRSTANPETAGVLILLDPHSGSDPIEAITETGLLQVVEDRPNLSPALTGIRRVAQRIDQAVGESTRGVGDLRTLAFVLLIALGVRQLGKGQLLAPAASLFWYAFDLMRFARPTHGGDPGER
ncbi:MAG: hypothetical protein LJE61_02705 [Thiocapsa sp.]|jgi:hypothetical protein|nr:hypothetical protein [Thiocapsa sp.]MCG6896823.1 hypothetical protein [Thiocapsa sp.]MCG6984099.1 hypothetical protein [Thiocapsa sp.]